MIWMTKARWIGRIFAVTVFLAAFGISLALTVFQVSREIPATITVSPVVVLSSGDLGLYHDPEGANTVTSLNFRVADFQLPLRQVVGPEIIYIRNESSVNLTLIEPCREVVVGGQRIGFINPRLHSLQNGDHLGSVCDRDVGLSPGEMVSADVDIHDLGPRLAPGHTHSPPCSGRWGPEMCPSHHLRLHPHQGYRV